MQLQQLRSYKFVSIQSWCCTESPKISKQLSKVFPQHYIKKISNPIRRIDFKQKVRMGEIETKIHGIIHDIERDINQYDKYCVDFVPLLNINWIQQYKKASPYLIKEAIELFKKMDLFIVPGREEIINRNGDKSWFAKPKSKAKELENNIANSLIDLVYENNIDYISVNKLLQIAQEM